MSVPASVLGLLLPPLFRVLFNEEQFKVVYQVMGNNESVLLGIKPFGA